MSRCAKLLECDVKKSKVLLAASLLFLTACPNLGELLRSYGYTELRPPSTLMMPGTIVWVRAKKPMTVGIVCTQQAAMGSAFMPLVSPTAENFMQRALDANM